MSSTIRAVSARLALALGLLLPALPLGAPVARAADSPPPKTVTIPGTLQSKVGCPGDWQPNCAKTYLTYDPAADVWVGTFDLPKGEYEYKVALNDSWTENYGGKADAGGANIVLSVPEARKVTFYYDHKTHWVIDSVRYAIPIVIGTWQSKAGCKADNDPGCRVGFMSDPILSGQAAFVTTKIPPGKYEARASLNGSATDVYGGDGAKGGAALSFEVKDAGQEIYFGFDAATRKLVVNTDGAPKGSLTKSAAFWVTADTLVWGVTGSPRYTYRLHWDPEAKLALTPKGVNGGESIALEYSSAGVGSAAAKFPHLSGLSGFKLPDDARAKLPAILKSQIAVSVTDDKGKLIDITSPQLPGVLDELYAAKAAAVTLGPSIDPSGATVRVWAPTARLVQLRLFEQALGGGSAAVDMKLDSASGVWSASGDKSWIGKYYLFEVEVYSAREGKIVRNTVTDPYSVALSMNSKRSQILDLRGEDARPAGWEALKKPALASLNDSVIYELHIRDFSSIDASVPAAQRGTYLAFANPASNGMKHLKALADAGLTHVHLLPAFDIASVNEDPAQRSEPNRAALAALPPDSEAQQAELAKTLDKDAFNWGYDPYHFNAPEGSYATAGNADGAARIREFRSMIQGLNQAGLRVVMDVVYNHSSQSGTDEKSVFDKIVPGYYYRLNNEGAVERSTCCENTASENAMMEKFILDSVTLWAREHKVDGFRFDLMGHHMLANMVKVRAALDALTIAKDGVDGKKIVLYGEGWNFGEVADNKRGKNATQLNLAGTGIGSFNDRLRDAVRGGNPFDDRRLQGFATGLFTSPSKYQTGLLPAEAQRAKLLEQTDWIRLGLAGNLTRFKITRADDALKTGEQVLYTGQPAAYAGLPQENIVYVSAHDNETLFDKVQFAAPDNTTLADRIRMNNLAADIALLSQGLPFFHAGDDILRSKSMDGNSYNSGDWFNAIDWTYADNGWGRGLPLANGNKDRWPVAQSLLANKALKPSQTQIIAARDHFLDMLRLRKSSPLFRLTTADEVLARVSFLNEGAKQTPGLIVMALADDAALDPNYARILVFFNANPGALTWSNAQLPNGWKLHPILAASADSAMKQAAAQGASFTIPGRSTVVFVLPKGVSLAPAGGLAVATPAAVGGGGAGSAVPTPAPVTEGTGAAPAAATPAPKPLLPPTGGSLQQNPPESPPDYGSLLGLVVTGVLGIAALFVIRSKQDRDDQDKKP
ncbi:MAG TPA: pullulanase-type alpha-1,6-glucosidase [Thermoflexales bacterium]|nr:pullulanase-type alpha-1,6-glucosidase [Thermoflexales bacterium]